jgi:glycosyltransferase involved in cell wall biosynthesis
MRVLHLYAGNLFGGIERLLLTWAKHQPQFPEVRHEFGLCFPGLLSERLQELQVPVHTLGPVRFSRPWTVWRARRTLAKLLAQERYEVVVAHAAWPHAVFATTVQEAGKPLVTFAHDVWEGQHWIERWAARTPPTRVVANSYFTAASVPEVFPNRPVDVVYLPAELVDYSAVNPTEVRTAVRQELLTPADDLVILCAARWERWKGAAILLEAATRLKPQPAWRIWMLGGAQRPAEQVFFQECQTFARTAGLEAKVQFLGRREDVPRLMLAADLHCQPNTQGEPFGLAFVEALSAGLPLVTSDLGAAREIVTPEVGLLTEPNNPAATAAAIQSLLEDSTRRVAMSQAAVRRAKLLCEPNEQITQLHDRLAAAADPPPRVQEVSA